MRKAFLKTVYFQKLEEDDFRANIDIFKNIQKIDFKENITYFVGENGSGKSTLIENIAKEFGLNQEGGTKNSRFKTSYTDKFEEPWIQLSWSPTKFLYGYFFRAEGMYNFVNYLEGIGGFDSYGGKNLHKMSHGEQFLEILEALKDTIGFYIIDEIEAAISPANQLRLVSIIKQMAENGSQFIIATHSPIILSIKENSQILSFDFGKIQEIEFDMVPCVDIYKRFFKKII